MMTKEEEQPDDSGKKYVGPTMAFDSAEHLFAAFPVLVAIANWTGRIGTNFITRFILTGRTKEAKRNAVILATAIGGVFLLLIAFMAWLALL